MNNWPGWGPPTWPPYVVMQPSQQQQQQGFPSFKDMLKNIDDHIEGMKALKKSLREEKDDEAKKTAKGKMPKLTFLETWGLISLVSTIGLAQFWIIEHVVK